VPDDQTLYFPHVMFLKQDLIDEMFFQIKNFLKSNENFNFPIKINVKKEYESVKRFQSLKYNANFVLVMNNMDDLNYAKSLININDFITNPIL